MTEVRATDKKRLRWMSSPNPDIFDTFIAAFTISIAASIYDGKAVVESAVPDYDDLNINKRTGRS